MSNNNFENIQSLSYSKLAEYDQTRIDLSIRKYVLISNLLREPTSPSNKLEQQWFDTCINELEKEETKSLPAASLFAAPLLAYKSDILLPIHL